MPVRQHMGTSLWLAHRGNNERHSTALQSAGVLEVRGQIRMRGLDSAFDATAMRHSPVQATSQVSAIDLSVTFGKPKSSATTRLLCSALHSAQRWLAAV